MKSSRIYKSFIFIVWKQLSVPLNSSVAQSFHSISSMRFRIVKCTEIENPLSWRLPTHCHWQCKAFDMRDNIFVCHQFCLCQFNPSESRLTWSWSRADNEERTKAEKRRIALVRIFYFYFASWWNLKQQSIVFLLSRYFCWFINSSAYAFWERLITFQSEMPLSRCAPKSFRKTMIWIQLLKCKKWKNKNFDSVCRILAFFYYDSDPHQWRPIIPRKRNASDTLLQTNKSLKRISLISIRWTNTGCKCNPNKKYNINWEKTNADCASTRTKNVKSKTFSISDSI